MATWTDNSGKSSYGAISSHCSVLLIVSECESQPGPDVVQRRAASELTEEWRGKLENQGIPREHQHDDLSIVKARYALDSKYNIVDVVMNTGREKLTRDWVFKKIKTTMNNCNCDKDVAVVLHYIGAGKRSTGDWCFEDGFITFRDLADLYLQLLRGHMLGITSDCSHSGSWVRECMTFLDEQGVRPCGHSARDKGILLAVGASCLSHEVPRQLAYPINGSYNDKNTGLFVIYCSDTIIPHPVTDGQHSIAQNFTQVRCGVEDITCECQCLPQANWQSWSVLNRVVTIPGPPKWILLLIVDDEETVANLMDTGFENYADYCQVLKVGYGEEPTKREFQEATKEYTVYRNKTN